ncbi:MAG: hypothetical protein AB7L90_21375 [Hyphomicrobiaceae bacterium]
MQEHRSGERNVWSDTYRGYRIAANREQSVWRVTLGDESLPGVGFDSPQEATAWLRRRVDDRIAEAIFPGLARR